jgi:glycerophosphoryl diester phosphodiesterase
MKFFIKNTLLIQSSAIVGALIFLLLFFFISCNKAKELPLETPPDQLQTTDIIFLGHRGSGTSNASPSYIENTMPSVLNGLKTMPGVEIDIQMSLDGTIWMFHDPDLTYDNCGTNFHPSLILLHDSVIASLQRCNATKHDRIYALSELLTQWNASAAGYYISLEVKTDFPADTFAIVGGRQKYLTRIADTLASMLVTMQHPAMLFFEVRDPVFCSRMKSYTSGRQAKICKLIDSDFENQISASLSQGFDGLSCSFSDTTITADKVKLAKNNGLVVQMWTPYTPDELKLAFEKHPTVIQSDNIEAKKLLQVQ